MMKTWTVSDITHAEPVVESPRVSILEFKDRHGEQHDFEILATNDRIIFGSSCNAGFLESGYIERDENESLDESLCELLADLEVFYNDGAQYVSRIVCNERM